RLISGVAEAIEQSRATCVYISNLMTQPGETQGYSVTDHVRAIYQHTRRPLFDWAVINDRPVSPAVLRRYRCEGAELLRADVGELQRMGRSEEHTSELQSRGHLVCRLLLEKKNDSYTNPRSRAKNIVHKNTLHWASPQSNRHGTPRRRTTPDCHVLRWRNSTHRSQSFPHTQ